MVRSAFIGLIPAWAGKTYERKTGQPITAAHPRVGGENTFTYRQGRDA